MSKHLAPSKRVAPLKEFYNANQRMPSYAEMCCLFNVKSKNAVFRIVNALCEQGIIKRDSNGKLIPLFVNGYRLVGSVEAGLPSPAEEELGDFISLEDLLIQNRATTVMVKVSGNSMTGAGIHAGDIVFVDRSMTAKRDDIVIANVDGEWTLKRYIEEPNGQIVLKAENPDYPSIIAHEELIIYGVVVSSIRTYR